MMGVNVNPYPILLTINYWEIASGKVAHRLDELVKKGISQVGSFVPWQAAESDISHSLTRFLQMAADRKLHVYLILSPEVGVHYPNSGLPKDLLAKKENFAADCNSEKCIVHLPPNSFPAPSYFSHDFSKRYYSFLTRIDGFLSDLTKNQPTVMKDVTISLSGSFWKYYRSPRPGYPNAGDYSSQAALAFRQKTEHQFSQNEFCDPTPASSNRWKTRGMEPINRKWFYQHAEDVFRMRSTRAVSKKSSGTRIQELEIYTPEADPSLTYHRFLQIIAGASTDFARLSALVDEAAARYSACEGHPTSPFIHWTSMGGFKNLSEPQKQFLLIKSLLLMATRGGGICMDDTEWLGLSIPYRTRVEGLVRSLTHEGAFKLKAPVLYLTPHLWSGGGVLWEELVSQLGPQVRMVSSIEAVLRERTAHLLVVDPSFVIMREGLQKLSAWAKAGRMLVVPRSTLYTEAARTELEKSTSRTKKIEVTLNLPYTLHAFGEGNLVVYDLPKLEHNAEAASQWKGFVSGLLCVADIQSVCQTTDHRLTVIAFEIHKEGIAIFVLNGSKQTIQADIVFPTQVSVVDLGTKISQFAGVPGPDGVSALRAGGTQAERSAPAKRFELNVPPLGVLPLKIEGLDFEVLKERHIAAANAKETRESAHRAAESELTGLSSLEGNLEDLWN